MAIKNNIDQLDNNELLKYLNSNKINPNTFISNGTYTIPLLFYLMKMGRSVVVINQLIEIGGNINIPLINNYIPILDIGINYFPFLKKVGYILNDDQIGVILKNLFINGDIDKIIALHKTSFVTKNHIIEIVSTNPNLIMEMLDTMYINVGELCRSHMLSNNDLLLNKVIQLDKNYTMIIKLIYINNIDLNSLINIEDVIQMVLNSYMYNLISYMISVVDHYSLINVTFYHYSNFPLINKIIMSKLYNYDNYISIKKMLKDKMFIKKIVKKKTKKYK